MVKNKGGFEMKKVIGIIAGIVFLLLLSSGIFAKIVEFGTWFFMLQYSGPKTSIGGEIVVRALTFLVSYGLVGIIFEIFGLYNSRLMKIGYFVISTIAGFILAYVVWTIEEHLLIVGIVLAAIAVLIIVLFVIRTIVHKRKKTDKNKKDV